MRRATLIVNGNAGSAHRLAQHRVALERIFATHGIRTHIQHTTPEPHSARQLAAEAAQHSDLILACGGDGTVHDVLQGVANTPASLGVLPLGTANALARNLALPLHPVAAVEKLLTYHPQLIPLGRATTSAETRWFTVLAGAGPDGRLMHEMSLAAKSRLGRNAYYLEAARLFFARSFHAFHVRYRPLGSPLWLDTLATALVASRVPNLGGLFRGLTPESQLHHPHLVVKSLAPPPASRLQPGLASLRRPFESGPLGSKPWRSKSSTAPVPPPPRPSFVRSTESHSALCRCPSPFAPQLSTC